MGKYLFIIGLIMVVTPMVKFMNGKSEDPFENMVDQLPLNKLFEVRYVVLTGIILLTLGIVSCSGGM